LDTTGTTQAQEAYAENGIGGSEPAAVAGLTFPNPLHKPPGKS